MPIYQIERAQVVEMSLTNCWRFFSDPRNLAEITPPSLSLTIKSKMPVEIYPGLYLEYTVWRLLGLALTWLPEIVHVEPSLRFVDGQRFGPYRVWHDEHFFRAVTDRTTEVRDLVTYVPPLGSLGRILNALVIRPQLARIFAYRQERLARLGTAPAEPMA